MGLTQYNKNIKKSNSEMVNDRLKYIIGFIRMDNKLDAYSKVLDFGEKIR